MFGYYCDSVQIKAEQPGIVVSHAKQIKPEGDPPSMIDILGLGVCLFGLFWLGGGRRTGAGDVCTATFSLWLHFISAPAKLKAFPIHMKQNCV